MIKNGTKCLPSIRVDLFLFIGITPPIFKCCRNKTAVNTIVDMPRIVISNIKYNIYMQTYNLS